MAISWFVRDLVAWPTCKHDVHCTPQILKCIINYNYHACLQGPTILTNPECLEVHLLCPPGDTDYIQKQKTYSTYNCSYPYSFWILDLPSSSHGIHPTTWGLFLWQVKHSLTSINDGETPLLVFPSPRPESVSPSTGLRVICEDWTSIDRINLV